MFGTLKKICSLYNKAANMVIFKLKGVACGENAKINGVLKVHGVRGKIIIGNNFVCNAKIKYNPIGGNSSASFLVLENGLINIGNNVGISNTAIASMKNITIEDDVMIGGGCKIYDTDFHSIKFEQRMEQPDTHIKSLPVTIKRGAFIGAHSIILKGVTVGEKSIVGAGSVVTKSIPDGEIWAGNPATFIRRIYE